MIKLPRCRHCSRPWKPDHGVVASKAYCKECSNERREIARRKLGLRPVTSKDEFGPYIVQGLRHRGVI